ncbi:MAG: hypothetical protein R3Y24_09145 [Eubacteriales bacterium]
MIEQKCDRSYEYLIEKFGESVIEDRFNNMELRANKFIEMCNLCDKISLNIDILKIVLIDYFTDIERLKDFEGIERTNKNKITAYMAYWWVRRKPLQLVNSNNNKEMLVYINEKFIATFIAKDFMSQKTSELVKNDECKKCMEHIYYHLKYRIYTAQTLEMFLLGIDTGIAVGRKLEKK